MGIARWDVLMKKVLMLLWCCFRNMIFYVGIPALINELLYLNYSIIFSRHYGSEPSSSEMEMAEKTS